jgi:hypothetical protein
MFSHLRAFLEAPLSVTVGSRDAALKPHFARASAFRLGPGEDDGTVFVSAVVADDIVADVRANGLIAVTMTDMETLSARQVKGTTARVTDADAADAPLVHAMRERAYPALAKIAGETVGSLLVRIPERPMLAISFKISAVFDQTPRPGAGERIA